MQDFMGIVLVLIMMVLLVFFKDQSSKVKRTKTECKELKQKMETMEKSMSDTEKFQKAVWENVNTIHLYAVLSGEEAKTESLKEKQRQIRQMAEDLLEKVK